MRYLIKVIIIIGLVLAVFLFVNKFIRPIVYLGTKKELLLVFVSAIMLIIGGFAKDKMDN